jgi:hypothetical protein
LLRTYTFATPRTWGFGSLAAATASVIADLEPFSFYELHGRPSTTLETAEFLSSALDDERLGIEASAVRFCRTFSASRLDEFRIELDETWHAPPEWPV